MSSPSPHRRRLAFALVASATAAVVGVTFVAGAPEAAGAPAAPAAEPAAGGEGGVWTPAEAEVRRLYDEGKLLTARRKAEELLASDADSIVGHYVMGCIEHEAEGSLPRAMGHIGRARELYERRWSDPAAVDAPRQLHREILFTAQQLAGELGKHEYRLELLDYHDSLYDPDLVGEHAWPLMHLGRFEEARASAKAAAREVDAQQRSLGLNAACAIEGEAGTREERFSACLAAFDAAAARAAHDDPFARPEAVTSLTVHAYNAALAADAVLRPDEVERLALAGTRRLEFTPANPWRLLVRLHLRQGRTEDAVAALREMQNFRRQQPPQLRDQVRADADATFAEVLLVAGEAELASRVMDRAIERPDRGGLQVGTPEQVVGAHALLRRAVRRTQAELAAERRSYAGVEAPLERGWERVDRAVAGARDDERIVAVAADDERLVATFRMFVHGGLEPVAPWLLGDLVEVLGPGVVEVVLESVRGRETLAGMTPYYDALAAEVALARGDADESMSRAKAALAALPEAESLLRARVAAVAATAARELGQGGDELGFLVEAMQRDAGVIRRRGMSLPARIENRSTGAAGEKLAELLAGSPRLVVGDEGGFLITLEGTDDALDACLAAPDGTSLTCARTRWPAAEGANADAPAASPPPPEEDRSPLAYARRVAEDFHRQAFAMPVALTSVDLGSLDGSATMSATNARERARALLDTLGDEPGGG